MRSDTITAWRTETEAFSSSDDLVPWWSVTKTVLAVACLRLAEQGHLDLDARLNGRAYSLQDLLRHTAGVASYTDWPEYHAATQAGEPAWADEVVLAKAQALGPSFPVGTRWAYSNTGYLMVRHMVEAATGQPIDAALREIIFDPLGLKTAGVARAVEDLKGCRWLDGSGYDPKWVYHGLIVGSASDACRFIHAVGTGQFVTDKSYARMITPFELGGAIAGRPWARAAYGLGVMNGDFVTLGPVFGHSGNGPGSVAAVYCIKGAAVCAFAGDDEEYDVEWETQRMALDLRKGS